MSVHVFAYGTLMIPQVMQMVTGHQFVCEPALLPGYARYGLRGETYPALVPEAVRATDGVLWRDVDAESLARLDAFEGDWYARLSVQALLGEPPSEASSIDAVTYALIDDQRHRLNHRRWSRDRFETHHLAQFLKDYRGFAATPATDIGGP